VRITKEDGTDLQDAAIGDGPVDAIFKSINRLVETKSVVIDYEVKSVTSGSDALGEVTVRIAQPTNEGDNAQPTNGGNKPDERPYVWVGHGVDAGRIYSAVWVGVDVCVWMCVCGCVCMWVGVCMWWVWEGVWVCVWAGVCVGM